MISSYLTEHFWLRKGPINLIPIHAFSFWHICILSLKPFTFVLIILGTTKKYLRFLLIRYLFRIFPNVLKSDFFGHRDLDFKLSSFLAFEASLFQIFLWNSHIWRHYNFLFHFGFIFVVRLWSFRHPVFQEFYEPLSFFWPFTRALSENTMLSE